MDGYNEKKWFVYIGDHHEGPFSLSEMEAKMKDHQVTAASFVWCEGMSDWKVMTEVKEFESLTPAREVPSVVLSIQDAESASPEPELGDTTQNDLARPGESIHTEPVVAEPSVILSAAPAPRHDEPAQSGMQPSAEPEPANGNTKQGIFGRLVFLLLSLLVVAGGSLAYTLGYLDPVLKKPAVQAAIQASSDFAQPYLIKAIEAYPDLGRWISPLPSLEDVSMEDYDELRAAAATKAEPGSLKVAVALSKTDPTAPRFYIATNLPDGAKFDVFVVGIPETLMNQLSSFTVSSVSAVKRLGETAVIRATGGQAIPRGQYMVYVMESQDQFAAISNLLSAAQPDMSKKFDETGAALPKGRKVVAVKTYFLGGLKDMSYVARLKEFHDRLREKAQSELVEIKLFAKALQEHLDLSVAKYSQLHKGRAGKILPAQKKAWMSFSKEWDAFDRNLNQSFQKWTPSTLEKEYFYSALYSLTVQAGAAVQRAHSFHDAYFTSATPVQGYDTQVDESVSSARSALAALDAKLKQAESTGPTVNGMPRRDGL